MYEMLQKCIKCYETKAASAASSISESRSASDQPCGRDRPPGRDDMWAPVTGLAAGSQKLAAAWLRTPAGCIIAGCRLEPKCLLSILWSKRNAPSERPQAQDNKPNYQAKHPKQKFPG